ncbi:MAG TPA: NAD(P)H-binding protein [Candidatus Dormibacteraeota bacterium]
MSEKLSVLVTGGTGALGRQVVMLLRDSGHRARILSRHPKGHVDTVEGDLATGAGLDRAVRGMDAVIHAASATTNPFRGRAVDVSGTRRLLAAARDAHVAHFLYVSIVGMEGVSYPYYRTKLKAEAVVREDIVPWSILRATQFHTLMEFFLEAFCRVPGLAAVPLSWQFQPVDPRDVARRLVAVVTQAPSGMLPDFGGPEVRGFGSLARAWLDARHSRRRLVNLPLPLQFSRQFTTGKLLTPEHRDGAITFEQYLKEKYG